MSGERDQLRSALERLSAGNAPAAERRLSLLAEGCRAYLRAREIGTTATLDLRDDLPAPAGLLSMSLEFASAALSRELAHEFTPSTFENACIYRTGLQAMLDATDIEADVEDADTALRRSGREGYLEADKIPDVPPSHWWWWLPDDPPAS